MKESTPLSFYDHHRQRYAANVPLRAGLSVVAEFMIGGYDDDGCLDERGEFAIALHDFDRGSHFPQPNRPKKPLSPQIRVFTDEFDALREFCANGGLDLLEAAEIHHRDDLSRLLLNFWLRDRSDYPLPETAVK